MLYLVASKIKNPLFVWGWDRKIRPLQSPFVITRQALWCQSGILGTDFSIPLSHLLWLLIVSSDSSRVWHRSSNFNWLFFHPSVFQQFTSLQQWKLWVLNLASDFIWPFLPTYKGVIPNPKMAHIFPILCILGIIFPKSLKNVPKYKGIGRFPHSQIKSLLE